MCKTDVKQACIPNVPFFGKCCNGVISESEYALMSDESPFKMPKGEEPGELAPYPGIGELISNSIEAIWKQATQAQQAVDLALQTGPTLQEVLVCVNPYPGTVTLPLDVEERIKSLFAKYPQKDAH